MAWFNRLSPDGLHVVGQEAPANTVVLNGRNMGAGVSPVWWTPTRAIWSVPGTVFLAWVDVQTNEDGVINVGLQTNNLQGWGTGTVLAAHRKAPVGWSRIRTDGIPIYTFGDVPYLLESGDLSHVINPSVWQGRTALNYHLWMQNFLSPEGDTRLVVSRVNDKTQGWIVATGNTFDPDMRASGAQLRVVYTGNGGVTKEVAVNMEAPMVSLQVGDPPPPPPPPPPIKPMNTEFASFRWSGVTFHKCGSDLADFKVTVKLDDAYVPSFNEKGIITSWRNPGWPEGDYGPGPGLVGNCGIVAKIDGIWRVATYDWLRYPDQDEKAESLATVRHEQINERPWTEWNPPVGEVIGLFVSAPVRGEQRSVRERSAIAWVKVGQRGILAHEYTGGGGVVDPPPPPDPKPEPIPEPVPVVDLSLVLAELAALRAEMARLSQNNIDEGTKQDIRDIWQKLDSLRAQVAALPQHFPVYTGKVRLLGSNVSIRLTPEVGE